MKDSRIVGEPQVCLHVTLRLTESEARALDALTGYGDEQFLSFFYTCMGKHYMQPHEPGLRSLFHTVRANLPHLLAKVDEARDVFTGRKRAVNHPTRAVVEGSKI